MFKCLYEFKYLYKMRTHSLSLQKRGAKQKIRCKHSKNIKTEKTVKKNNVALYGYDNIWHYRDNNENPVLLKALSIVYNKKIKRKNKKAA